MCVCCICIYHRQSVKSFKICPWTKSWTSWDCDLHPINTTVSYPIRLSWKTCRLDTVCRLKELLANYEGVELSEMLVSMAQSKEAAADMDILMTLVPEVERRYNEDPWLWLRSCKMCDDNWWLNIFDIAQESMAHIGWACSYKPRVYSATSQVSLLHSLNNVWALCQMKITHKPLLKRVAEDDWQARTVRTVTSRSQWHTCIRNSLINPPKEALWGEQ